TAGTAGTGTRICKWRSRTADSPSRISSHSSGHRRFPATPIAGPKEQAGHQAARQGGFMDARRLLRGFRVLVPVLSLLACGGPAAGRSAPWHGSTASLAVGAGPLEVTLRPDRDSSLQLTPD